MIITQENYQNFTLGAKAENLFYLSKHGYPVPDFFAVSEETTEEELNDYLDKNFSKTEKFSVRSSASVEDGGEASFAGQFRTILDVGRHQVMNAVRKVMDIPADRNLSVYCSKRRISPEQIHMTVIIQEMVQADISGILFTANPQGLLNEMVIVAGCGSGENVVTDRIDTTTYYYNRSDALYYYEQQGNSPLLKEEWIEELIRMAEKTEKLLGAYCDIEFAISRGEIFLIQARLITSFDAQKETIVLDNSNIVESYPGITLPLTQSFVREVYYRVFKSCLLRLTHDKKKTGQVDEILRNMVDVVNGRIYYRISNWYDVILFLPFSRKIIPVWQEMLGVEHKTVSTNLKDKIGFRVRFKTTISFFSLLFTNLKKMKELDMYFEEVLDDYHKMDFSAADNGKLTEYYQTLKGKVTDQWDITLVNDMYSFIFTGLLKAWLKFRKVKEYETATNRYISDIADIESLKPVRRLADISRQAVSENRLEELNAIVTNEDFYAYVMKKPDDFKKELTVYIEQYGDRNLEELKLESKTFRTDPVLLVQRIRQYAKDGLEVNPQEEKPLPHGIAGFLAKKAAAGIKNREKSRLNRSRLYGIMRFLMLKTGENFYHAGRMEKKEDIFWLYYDEVEQAIGNGQMELAGLIQKRKEEYRQYQYLPDYTRLVFSGNVWNKNANGIKEKEYKNQSGIYCGVPCSHGVAEGEVLLVDSPAQVTDTKDKILVTKMTDPGWVFLIAGAKAIVAEKGSLLSHTAIISRELEKPAVVAVSQITKILKTGDYVRVDGNKGEVVLLSPRK